MLAYGRPPGRKHRANNERSPAPVLITQPQCFKKIHPKRTEGKVKRLQVVRVKAELDVCF